MAEKILLVEDEEKLARMVEMELKYEGYEVEKALNGRSGQMTRKLTMTSPVERKTQICRSSGCSLHRKNVNTMEDNVNKGISPSFSHSPSVSSP